MPGKEGKCLWLSNNCIWKKISLAGFSILLLLFWFNGELLNWFFILFHFLYSFVGQFFLITFSQVWKGEEKKSSNSFWRTSYLEVGFKTGHIIYQKMLPSIFWPQARLQAECVKWSKSKSKQLRPCKIR